MFCAPTLESTSSFNSLVLSRLGVIGTCARWIFKKSGHWDNNKLEAARRLYWEPIVIFWTRSFTVRVTESGPKSRNHSIPSLEAEKVTLLYCRQKVYELRLQTSFWKIVSTNGKSTWFCHKWNDFHLLSLMFRCDWLWLVSKCLRKRSWFFFFVVTTRLFDRAVCAIAAKQHLCRFLVFERKIQSVVTGFALFTVVELRRFIGWKVNTLLFFHMLDNTYLQ